MMQVYQSLVRLKKFASIPGNDVASLNLTFEVTRPSSSSFSSSSTIELIPNGGNIAVTNDNYRFFIHRFAHHRLNEETLDQNRAFLAGFRELIPLDMIRLFSPQVVQNPLNFLNSLLYAGCTVYYRSCSC